MCLSNNFSFNKIRTEIGVRDKYRKYGEPSNSGEGHYVQDFIIHTLHTPNNG